MLGRNPIPSTDGTVWPLTSSFPLAPSFAPPAAHFLPRRLNPRLSSLPLPVLDPPSCATNLSPVIEIDPLQRPSLPLCLTTCHLASLRQSPSLGTASLSTLELDPPDIVR